MVFLLDAYPSGRGTQGSLGEWITKYQHSPSRPWTTMLGRECVKEESYNVKLLCKLPMSVDTALGAIRQSLGTPAALQALALPSCA